MDASSDSGAGVHGVSNTGLAGLFDGDVQAKGSLSSGPGTLASNAAGTPAISAAGTNGADGVDTSSDSGRGVFAQSSTGDAVFGLSEFPASNSAAIHGRCFSGLAGLFDGDIQANGNASFASFNGVSAIFATSSGVAMHGNAQEGPAVLGESTNGTAVLGTSLNGVAGQFNGNVNVLGNLSVNGTKSFIQGHPTDPDREIVYVALEGGEAGTYVRGTGHLQDGKAVVPLPEHFGLVTAHDGLTVQLTPHGEWLQLYVAELGTDQLVVREAQDKSGLFDYFVSGVRKGYEHHEVIRPKR